MRWAPVILVLVGLGCGLAGGLAQAEDAPVPLPRPRPPLWIEPHSFAEANPGLFDTSELTAEPSDCRKALERIAVVEPLPRLIGPGECGGSDMVALDAVLLADASRVEIKPAAVLRCTFAAALTDWLREDVSPDVAKLGSALRAVENYNSFECRGRNRVLWAKLSEHGKGDAIDVRAFISPTVAASRSPM